MLELDVSAGFMEVTRVSPLSFRSIDVGVVLDMMIHDIDIVLQLARSPIQSIDAVGVSVIGDAEDVCNARVRFENGCVANIAASRLSLKTERKLRVFGKNAYVSLDYQKAVRHRDPHGVEPGDGEGNPRQAAQRRDRGFFAAQLHRPRRRAGTEDRRRRAAAGGLESFVAAVRGERPPAVSAADGLAAVEVAERIVSVMTGGRVG
jgi:predicted dehydrogenase